MKKNGDEIRISTSHTTLRAIGFVVALVVAVAAFSFGIASIGNKEPGYYEIEATPNELAERYAQGFTLTCYFDGESNDIKAQMAQAQEVYSTALLRAYMLLDADNTYDGVVNLATLNASLGQSVTVGDELLAVLTDAWEKTQQGSGYSLFAGALLREWESILTLSDAAEYDPLRNVDSAARIRMIYERTMQPNAFSLAVDGNVVRVDAAPGLSDFLRENEYDDGVVNTGLLHDAYLLSIVRDALEAHGIANGYLVSDSGLTISLSAHSGNGAYCFYSLVGEEATQTATVAMQPGSTASFLRSFPLTEDEFMYYTVGDVHRSSVAALTSDTSAVVLQSCLAVHGDVVQAAYDSLVMMLTGDRITPSATAVALDSTIVYAIWSADMLYFNHADVIPAEGVSTIAVQKMSDLSAGQNEQNPDSEPEQNEPDTQLKVTVTSQTELDALAQREDAGQITHVYGFGADITDISALSSLSSLTELQLGDNHISDISVLSGLTSLTKINLEYNSICDISALSGLTELKELYLNYNNINGISALSTLTGLTKLWLEGCKISDINALGTLVNLTELGLYDNGISDISVLHALTSLTYLGLCDNSVSDISMLGGLTDLKELDLSVNSIEDISALSALTGLTYLNLGGNPSLAQAQINSLQTQLPGCEIVFWD